MVKFENYQDDFNSTRNIEDIILNKLMENFRQGNPFVSLNILKESANTYNSIHIDKAIKNLTTNGIIYKATEDNFQITRYGVTEYERRQKENAMI